MGTCLAFPKCKASRSITFIALPSMVMGGAIGKGFFVIADDASDGRYAMVVEDLKTGKGELPKLLSLWKSTIEKDAEIITGMNKAAGKTAGPRSRNYLPILLEGTGTAYYFNSNVNSVDLKRLQPSFKRQYFEAKKLPHRLLGGW